MRKRLLIVGTGALLTGIVACNTPTRSAVQTPIAIQFPTSAGETPATQPPTEGIEMPDIQGTVGALGTATTDPDALAHVTGDLAYAGEDHPAMRVYAIRTDGQRYQFVEVNANVGSYALEVPAGEYYILADVAGEGEGRFEGGYSQYSACAKDGQDAAGCESMGSTLVALLLQPGQVLDNIDIVDWMADTSWPDVP